MRLRRWFEAARFTVASHPVTGFDGCLHAHKTFSAAVGCAKKQGFDLVASIELTPIGKRVRATMKTGVKS